MKEPRRIWWARPRKLCALERPGGGGRSHRPERRTDEIEYLKAKNVRTVVSVMQSRHNADAYDEAGIAFVHVPVDEDRDGLLEVCEVLRRETRKGGAVALHGNRYTDFVAAVCAQHLYDYKGDDVEDSLDAAIDAGLAVTIKAAELVEADPEWIEEVWD